MIYLLTTIVLTPGGSSTVHIYTQKNIQNRAYITIRIRNITKRTHNLQIKQKHIKHVTIYTCTMNDTK